MKGKNMSPEIALKMLDFYLKYFYNHKVRKYNLH